MASNFFEQQDVARKKTGLLVGLFAAALVGIVLLVYGVVVLVLLSGQDSQGYPPGTQPPPPPYVEAFVMTVLGVLVVVGGASLYKIIALRSGGGESVAQMLGGRLLQPQTNDLDERKILNVVEEMALASGTPVPPVYLMENESGINAFAAGYTPDNAVIGITRGAIEKLSRDELQGVIAHEFSHILNGDMRMNIRLMGVIFGLIAIAVIGRVALHAALYSGGGRGRKDGRAVAAMLGVGLALLIIGGIGIVVGRMIQAAVSRQREYLADASAVQFTRNPDSIGGALKRIGAVGSSIQDGHSDEASHMFIANAMSSWAFGPFATHPPLEERIKRIDPSWDGKYPDPGEVTSPLLDKYGHQRDGERPKQQPRIPVAGEEGGALPGMPGGMLGTVIGGAIIADAAGGGGAPANQSAVDQIGQVSPTHIAYMRELLGRIPEQMKDAAHEPQTARAVVYTLLLDGDSQVRAKQIESLGMHADPAVMKLTERLAKVADDLPMESRLPLVDLAVPALREMSDKQYAVFKTQVEALIKADGRVDLFEWVLQRVLVRHLDLHFVPRPDPSVKYYSLKALTEPCQTVLSALAHIGQRDPGAASRAFEAGVSKLELAGLDMQDRKDVKLSAVGEALDELIQASPREKKKVIQACATTIAADGEVTRGEGELMRAVADALGVPMPPLLPGQKLV